LLREVARLGKTIIFSSHILADVAELCTRVGIMEAGRLTASGTLDELSQRTVPHRLVRVGLLKQVSPDEAIAALMALPGVSNVHPREGLGQAEWFSFEAEFTGDDAALAALLGQLLQKGLPVIHFSEETKNLEQVFLHATQGIVS
jgi:ABC-2 type transport system ATP-binding protein